MAGRPFDSWRQELPHPDDWRGGGEQGGFWRRFFAGFTTGNPMDWAFPLYTAWGIRVRVHLLFLIVAAWGLLEAGMKGYFAWKAFGTGSLFVLVLLHEYGHCIACRKMGGEADDILMWPLGGLASCRPPKTWKAELVTVLGGPAVNLVFALALIPVILMIGGGSRAVLVNPFALVHPEGLNTWWKIAIWYLYLNNVTLFLFNMLVPMFPMDCGRVLLCLLWIKKGYRRAMFITANVGLVTAGVLFVIGVLSQQSQLLLIATMGGGMCYQERQRIKFLEMSGEPEEEESPWAESLAWREDRASAAKEEKAFREAAKKQQRELAEARRLQAEEDRILAKIASEGMQSLTRGERKTLEEATRRRRG